MTENGTLIFRNGKWVEGVVEPREGVARFDDIKFYYPILIDYARVACCIFAGFTVGMKQPLLTAALLFVSTLLDWVDGPVARACNQCTVLGSGVDWFADILGQIVTMAWWISMSPAVMPWLVIATAIQLANCVFDFATTATGSYPKLERGQKGFSVILEWSMPGGAYSRFGTFLWLAFPVFSLACCLDLSWPERSPVTGQFLRDAEYLLAGPAVLYVWCELAYAWFIIKRWTEAPRNSELVAAEKHRGDGAPGVEFLGILGPREQALLRSLAEGALNQHKTEWEASRATREVFSVSLWPWPGQGAKSTLAGGDELDRWARALVATHYKTDGVELAGYGFTINPPGSMTQPWQSEEATERSLIFVPLSRLTANDAVQCLVLPAEFRRTVRAAIDRIELDEVLAAADYVNVRQLQAKPFSLIKLDFGAIHRETANTEPRERSIFWLSVKRAGPPPRSQPAQAVAENS